MTAERPLRGPRTKEEWAGGEAPRRARLFTRRDAIIGVVTFVLVMVAATAILTHRRHSAFDDTARRDLYVLAALQAAFVADNPASYATSRQLISAPYSFRAHGEAIYVKSFKTNVSFCLRARSRSGRDYYYDSTRGGILPDGQTC